MQVTYKYPYIGYWNKHYKYGQQVDTISVKLNSNNTWAVVTNNPLPNVSKLKFTTKIGTQYYTGLFNREWDIYAYTTSGWEYIRSFTMPNYSDNGNSADIGRYKASITVDIELATKKTITKMAAVPSSRMGSGAEWYADFNIEQAVITENIPDAVLSDSDHFCGITERMGDVLYDAPSKVDVNIDGQLVTAKELMVNIDGELVALPKMQQYNFVATKNEQSVIITFTPKRTGKHIIKSDTQYAGSTNVSTAPFKIFDSEMNEITLNFGTSATLNLEAGKEYRMIVIDSPSIIDLAQRVVKVYSI